MKHKGYSHVKPIWLVLSVWKFGHRSESLECVECEDRNGCVYLNVSWFIVKPDECADAREVDHFYNIINLNYNKL